MDQASHIGANRSEWHHPDLRRSIDFHAVVLAMAGHDLRQHLQIILNSYGWLSARATNNPERERIARGQHAVMQMAEQLHQLITALHIHQKRSEEHTSELQSHLNLVCRLLLEKKKKNIL